MIPGTDVYTSIISIVTGSAAQTYPFTPTSYSGLGIFLVFIVLIVIRRVMRGIYGRRYSTGRVLFLPVFYVVLTLIFVAAFSATDIYAYYTFLLIPAGAIVGWRFGGGVSFFMKNGEVYYKRSPYILVVWLVSYILRVLLEFLFPSNLTIAFGVDAVLAITAGLIIGEAIHLIRGRRSFNQTPPGTEPDNFQLSDQP